jgi:hypothetical protein
VESATLQVFVFVLIKHLLDFDLFFVLKLSNPGSEVFFGEMFLPEGLNWRIKKKDTY